jgi:hypothetical protein
MHTTKKIPFIYSFSGNCAASVPISIFMCLWAIYIFPWSVHIFSWGTIGRPMWKLGLRPQNSISGNICFEFSVLCLCSAWRDDARNSQGVEKSEIFVKNRVRVWMYYRRPGLISIVWFFYSSLLSPANCLSFSVFFEAPVDLIDERGRGGGKEPNHTTERKPGPL